MRGALLRRSLLGLGAVALAGALAHAAPGQGRAQKVEAEAGGKILPIDVREEYLGRSGSKTAVRFTLTVSRADLRGAGALAPRVYSFYLTGEAKDAGGTVVESFREPIDVDLSDAGQASPIKATFLRALPPGPLELQFRLEGAAGKAVALRALSLEVPKMSAEFRVEEGGTPTAAAILLEADNREPVAPGVTGLIRFLPPSREVPVGLLRIECEVKLPITRVEFWLDDKKVVVKNRAPYEVELDLGKVPRKQTLKALGFDKLGNFVDADAWAINERDARLVVTLMELPRKAVDGLLDVKVAVQPVAGGTVRSVKLYLDDSLAHEWTAPPFRVSLPETLVKKATLIRATAWDEQGKEFSDIKLMKGDQRFLSKVEVNLVELNVTVTDAEGKFAKGLAKGDFIVLEDGQPQELSAFEFSESLPISLGIVIDGSGSMKDAMPLVKEAATEFVTRLVGEKDQGFVVEFRESAVLTAPLSKRPNDMKRAIQEARASGGTALYDAVVMALYQFHAVPGRKAIVVLSDGKDNHSSTEYATLRRYARSASVPIFFIGLDLSVFDVSLKSLMKELSGDTGGESFFVGKARDLADVYRRIEIELRSQYFLSFVTRSKKPEDQYRTIDVKLGKPNLKARTIRGYFP